MLVLFHIILEIPLLSLSIARTHRMCPFRMTQRAPCALFLNAPLPLFQAAGNPTDRTKLIYSMYRAGEVSVHRACCEGATQPYSIGGGGTIYPGSRPADVTTPSPRMVAECLLTRSMLIKMYYHFMVCTCIYSQSISCRCLLSLFGGKTTLLKF